MELNLSVNSATLWILPDNKWAENILEHGQWKLLVHVRNILHLNSNTAKLSLTLHALIQGKDNKIKVLEHYLPVTIIRPRDIPSHVLLSDWSERHVSVWLVS